ncbi:MAG: HNH endonuclease [Gemmataceae bacterium]|nr:HNH endonuclease [Gemmataceae bacterium]
MNPLYPKVAVRAGNCCEYCRAPEEVFNFSFEVEHITPRSLGGTDADNNLALGCRACNLYKSNRVRGIDPNNGEDVRVFNPREDHWEEHFVVDAESATLAGITSTGRATVSCLEMNTTAQVKARRQWIRLGLFP